MRNRLPSLDELKAVDTRTQSRNFVEVALLLARAGNSHAAAQVARKGMCNPIVLRMLERDGFELLHKALVPGGLVSDADHAALADLQNLSASFLATAAHQGVFDAIAVDAHAGQLHSLFGYVSTRPVGGEHVEGDGKPVGRMTAAQGSLQSRKAVAMVILSAELLRFSGAAAILEAALRESVVAVSDGIAIDELNDAAGTPVAAVGLDAGGIRHDLRLALDALTTSADSRLHLIVPTAVAKRLALVATVDGAQGFPEMTTSGGEIDSLKVTASDGLTTTALLLDARGLVAASDPLVVETSRQTSIEMETQPEGEIDTPVEVTMTSMFQTNSVALRAERRIALAQVRSGSVVEITGVSTAWGLAGSPPA